MKFYILFLLILLCSCQQKPKAKKNAGLPAYSGMNLTVDSSGRVYKVRFDSATRKWVEDTASVFDEMNDPNGQIDYRTKKKDSSKVAQITIVNAYGGKDTAIRYHKLGSDSFKIVYAYGNDYFDNLVGRSVLKGNCDSFMERLLRDGEVKGCTIDKEATDKLNRDNLHYYATIFVSKIDSTGHVIKAYPKLDGIYVPAGCYEDVPEEQIKKALILDDPSKDVYKIWCQSHKYGFYWLNDSDYMFHGKTMDVIGTKNSFGTPGRFSDEQLLKDTWVDVDNRYSDGGLINIMSEADDHKSKKTKK